MDELTYKNVLTAIWKHKAISVKQLALLFSLKRERLSEHIKNLKKKNYIGVVPNNSRTPSYYIKTPGLKILGGSQARTIRYVHEEHLTTEIKVLRYLVSTKSLKYKSHTEFLKLYETDREIKRRRYRELGMAASQLRTPDLIVQENTGVKVYEIELTKKGRGRYPAILHKLDKDFNTSNWEQIIWVIQKHDNRWYTEVFGKANIQANTKLSFVSKYNKD